MTINACHTGTGLNACFARVPERLVPDGYRRWLTGCEPGSVTPWEMAAMRHAGCVSFADTLSEFDQTLLPIAQTAINDVLARADQRRLH